MRRTILALVTTLALVACSTPDSDDVDAYARQLSASPTAVARLTTYAMNRYAIEWLLRTFDQDDPVGGVWCWS